MSCVDVMRFFNGREKEMKMITERDALITVDIPLWRVVRDIDACNALGLNPWCVAEGADRDAPIRMPLHQAQELGLV